MNSVIRKVSRVPLRAAVQRRGMAGGHHGPPPTYTGLEAKVRKFLPENHHVSAILPLKYC